MIHTFRWLLAIMVLLAGGCSASPTPQALVWVELDSEAELEASVPVLSQSFADIGFEIAAPRPPLANVPDSAFMWWQTNTVNAWRHEGRWFRTLDLHVKMTPYPPGQEYLRQSIAGANEPRAPFVEVVFFELRPGGFSRQGLRFHSEVVAALKNTGGNIRFVVQPPPTNERAYWFATAGMVFWLLVWWSIVWCVGVALFGATTDLLLRQVRASVRVRRAVLIVIAVMFATPFPLAAAFISVPAPNILALLGGLHYYGAVSDEYGYWIFGSFAISLIAGVAAARLFIGRGTPRPTNPSTSR